MNPLSLSLSLSLFKKAYVSAILGLARLPGGARLFWPSAAEHDPVDADPVNALSAEGTSESELRGLFRGSLLGALCL